MRHQSEVAKCAKEIRTILKNKFPECKFRVVSHNYSMGDSVTVHYDNFLPTAEIEKWISGFQYGHFDGMTDMYENSNRVEGRPQTKYLFVERHIDAEKKQAIKEEIAAKFGIKEVENEQAWYDIFHSWSDQIVWKEIQKTSFTGISQTHLV